jgi:hypothetical protein
MGGMAAHERLPATGLEMDAGPKPAAQASDFQQPDSRKRLREERVGDDRLHKSSKEKSKSSKEKREKQDKKEKKHKKEKREKHEKHHKSRRRRYDSD